MEHHTVRGAMALFAPLLHRDTPGTVLSLRKILRYLCIGRRRDRFLNRKFYSITLKHTVRRAQYTRSKE